MGALRASSALVGAGSALTSAAVVVGSVLISARYSRLRTAKEPSSQTGVAPAVRYPTRVAGATATWSRVDRAFQACDLRF
jgi:hypothetical protein